MTLHQSQWYGWLMAPSRLKCGHCLDTASASIMWPPQVQPCGAGMGTPLTLHQHQWTGKLEAHIGVLLESFEVAKQRSAAQDYSHLIESAC